MTTVADAGVHEGDVLAGKYRVERVLGVGGMGVVVAAHHLDLDERVAIKFLLPELMLQGDSVARFAREARAMVKIKSEHVAKVKDVGKLENGAPYMVMEFLEGSDLAAWLTSRGALPIEQAVEFVLQACEALAEAHSLGIVHRDLKPSNLFVIRRPDGVLSVKVLDFGISKLTSPLGAGGGSLTKTSALMGSPYYMSPEQMESAHNVDSRSDIWAVGIILYELLAGKPPFVADTLPELVMRVAKGTAPLLRTKRQDAPEGLEAIISRCLERDPRARFENVAELAVALVGFGPKRARTSVERISGTLRSAGFSGTLAALPVSSDGEKPRAGAGTANSWGKTTAPRARSGLLVAGAGALALVLGLLVWWARAGSTNADPVATTEAPSSAAPSLALPAAAPPVVMPAEPSVVPATPEPSSSHQPPPAVSSPVVRPVPGVAQGAESRVTPRPSPPRPEPAASPRPQPASPRPPASVGPRPVAPGAPRTPTIFDERK